MAEGAAEIEEPGDGAAPTPELDGSPTRSEGDEGQDGVPTPSSLTGGKKKRQWQKVTGTSITQFYDPKPYEAQKGSSKGGGKGKEKGKDLDGDGKGRGSRPGGPRPPHDASEAEPARHAEEAPPGPAGFVPSLQSDSHGGGRGQKGGRGRGSTQDFMGKGRGFGGGKPMGYSAGSGRGRVGGRGAPAADALAAPAGPALRPPAPAPGKGACGPMMQSPCGNFGPRGMMHPCGGQMPGMYMPMMMFPGGPMPGPFGMSGMTMGTPCGGMPLAADAREQLKQQIEYYFSEDNLIKDVYFRSRAMNEDGWVPAQTLANFKRVQAISTDLSLITEALQSSQKLEFDAENSRVRLADTWQKWVLSANRSQAPAQEAESPEKALVEKESGLLPFGPRRTRGPTPLRPPP